MLSIDRERGYHRPGRRRSARALRPIANGLRAAKRVVHGASGSMATVRLEGSDFVSTEIRFAHLSDWHATSLVHPGFAAFRGKRLSGYASWAISRRRHHSPEILAAAMRDVRAQRVDRVLVTGDLTHISLPAEFAVARTQLERLGSPEQVFLIPGNHDCYVPVPASESWDQWAPFLRGLQPGEVDGELAAALTPPPANECAPRHADFPTLRMGGPVAWIGLCSAIPTPIFRAGEQLGKVQLERLRRLLVLLGARGMCRVLMIHHPVHPHGEPERRALSDGQALRDLLAEVGAELVVHGHKHRRRVDFLDVPGGRRIPAIGVPSSSEVGSRPDRRAQYHVYTARPSSSGNGFDLAAEVRGYDAGTRAFVGLADRLF